MRKIPWRKKWQPTPVFLPGKSHEQRSLVGYSPWGYKRVEHNLVSKHKQQLWIHGVLIAPQTEFALVSCLSLHVLFFFLRLYWICYNFASVSCFGFWLWGMWDLGFLTPALEGKVLTTGPPRKSHTISCIWNSHLSPLCPSRSVRIMLI